jgi:hypothetical protein
MEEQDKQKRRDILAGRLASEETNELQTSGKSEARSDATYGEVKRIEGRTVGRAGSIGTGDPSGDFDRPGTEGRTSGK